MAPPLTEEEVAAASAGEPAALRRVYEVLSPRLVVYLRSRGSEDPEGLTQDVFVSLLPRLAQLRGGVTGLRTFAFSLAHARLVDETRRRTKRPPSRTLELVDDPPLTPSAEELALGQISGTALFAQLATLREDQRTVVALRVIGELSLEETAEVMGKSVGAVKQLQRRGLLALRELLQKREGVTS
jgi:RNA polymerase sigma-70 factor (ECF subfamily)